MEATFFQNQGTIAIKEYKVGFFECSRLEKAVRRRLLRQSAPDSRIIKRMYGFPALVGGLDRVTVRTPVGTRPLYFRPGTSDEDVLRETFHEWQYSLTRMTRWPGMLDLLASRHREDRRPLIIDAGANIGASAVFFALTFPSATIIAIEPEDSNFNLLQMNTRGLNVRCLKAALSSDTGRVKVLDPGAGPWAFRTQRVESGDGAPCTTISSLYDEHLEQSVFPFLVKIDIEGGEEDVFKQNISWLRDTPIVAIELHDWMLPGMGSALPFLRCVSTLDRDFVYFGETVYSIDNGFLRSESAQSVESLIASQPTEYAG